MSLYLLWGQEDYSIEREVKKLKTRLLDPNFASMNYKVLDNPDFLTVIEACQSPPLMFGNMLVLIYMDKYLIGKKQDIEDKKLAVFEEALKSIPESLNIVFLCPIPRDDYKKIDTRKKLYKIISAYAKVLEFPQYKTYQKELHSEIQKIAKEKDLVISSNTVNIFIEQLGSSLRLIDTELEKLKISIYPNKTVKGDDIKKYCVSSDDIFVLADLLALQNKDEILKQFTLLNTKRHYLEVLAVLQSSLQKFIFIKNYETKASAQDIGNQLKLHEFVIKKTMEKLSQISLNKLIKIKSKLTDAEYKIKTGESVNPQVTIELALLT